MTKERLYRLAFDQALDIWCGEHDYLEKYPENEIFQEREKRAWDELKEISRLIRENH